MHRSTLEALRLGSPGEIDPALWDNSVDTSPTLEAWAFSDMAADDRHRAIILGAAAYDAAVWSMERNMLGLTDELDLPVGCAIGDFDAGLIVPGFARDKETGDPKRHAEVDALSNLEAIREDLKLPKTGGLTMSVNLETCPSCLDEIEDSGMISRVMFTALRSDVEQLGLIKKHKDSAMDLVRAGRAEGKYHFEYLQYPYPAMRAASLELFRWYARDPETGKVAFRPELGNPTRFYGYSKIMREFRSSKNNDGSHKQWDNLPVVSEPQRMIDNYLIVLDKSYRPFPDLQ